MLDQCRAPQAGAQLLQIKRPTVVLVTMGRPGQQVLRTSARRSAARRCGWGTARRVRRGEFPLGRTLSGSSPDASPVRIRQRPLTQACGMADGSQYFGHGCTRRRRYRPRRRRSPGRAGPASIAPEAQRRIGLATAAADVRAGAVPPCVGGLQVDDLPRLRSAGDYPHEHRAAAGGQHHVLERVSLRPLALALPETRLALLFEDEGIFTPVRRSISGSLS